jgi:hypothetical protein
MSASHPETLEAAAVPSPAPTTQVSSRGRWTGGITGGLAVLFLLFDTVGKLLTLPPVVEGTTRLGYPASVVFGIGVVELGCLVVYLVPRTAVLGAILLTGYLGGAVATHVRIGSPLFTHVLFPVYVGLLIWGALVFRDRGLRALILRQG